MINISANADGYVQMKCDAASLEDTITELGLILATVINSIEAECPEAANDVRLALAQYLLICAKEGKDVYFKPSKAVSIDGDMLNFLQGYAEARNNEAFD